MKNSCTYVYCYTVTK